MPDNRAGARRVAQLDDMRMHNSYEKTRDLFHRLYEQDAVQAVNLLNDEGLSYPSLYILQPEISKHSLYNELTQKNKLALNVGKKLMAHIHPEDDSEPVHEVLRWMLLSGSSATGLGEEYDTVIDLSALLLIKVFGDKDILPLLADMIFSRHRKGLNTYDAEWALFESGDAECIEMIAKRLLSEDMRDVSMARRMLGFIPCFAEHDDARRQHQCVMQWLRRNRSFIKYTGESNQKCSRPRPFRVALEEKYIQQPLDAEAWNQLRPTEQEAVAAFKHMDEADKELLSDYSHQLHSTGMQQWQRWMNTPVSEQLNTAKRWQGARLT